jgi:hypothetical protein
MFIGLGSLSIVVGVESATLRVLEVIKTQQPQRPSPKTLG